MKCNEKGKQRNTGLKSVKQLLHCIQTAKHTQNETETPVTRNLTERS
jgi:hypothetical protein